MGVFAVRGLAESDIGISTRCAISMSDDIFVFGASVFAAQGLVGSDIRISTRYVLSMFI